MPDVLERLVTVVGNSSAGGKAVLHILQKILEPSLAICAWLDHKAVAAMQANPIDSILTGA